MSDKELNPCPMCGGDAEPYRSNSNFFRCSKRDCIAFDYVAALAEWQERAYEQEIKELKEELNIAKNTLYKLRCECEKCGNVWTEQIHQVRGK